MDRFWELLKNKNYFSGHLRHSATISLIVLLAWVPFPFGSNRPWSANLLTALTAFILLLLTLSRISRPTSSSVERKVFWPLFLFGCAVIWAFLQASTWTPASLHHPIWELANDALATSLPGRISVNPAKTVAAATHLVAYGALFWIALHLAKDRSTSKRLFRAVSVIVGLYAYYGLAVYLSGNGTILLYPKWEHQDALSSTFVNRNSFATFAGIGLVCSFTLILNGLAPILRSRSRAKVKIHQMQMVIRSSHLGSFVFMLGTLWALVLSGSRAGIFSTFVGLCVLVALMAPRSGNRSGRLGLAIGGLGILLLIALPASGVLLSRLDQINLFESDRFEIYQLTLRAIGDAPLVGTGLGTFSDVFASYRNLDAFSPSSWTKAHNTYLETWLELGLPAALILQGSIVFIVWQCFKGARRKNKLRHIPAAACSVSALVGVHSMIDFSLQIPAIAAMYAVVLGIGMSNSVVVRNSKHQPGIQTNSSL
jgi:O-antigen ligase